MYVCMSTFSNISSETAGPIEAKFHMEPSWGRGTKVCSNGPAYMAYATIYFIAAEIAGNYLFP